MSRLKHRTLPGCTYFVTTEAWQRRAIFQAADLARIVIDRILACQQQGAYLLHEFVLMPNHLHLLMTPGVSTSLERAMMLIKGGSSHQIHQVCGNKMEIWQSGFHDWTIRDAEDYRTKANYIRMNPVVAKLTERPEAWPNGSADGRVQLDGIPERFADVASGAEAPLGAVSNVGAKAPTP